ncbi:MAG TPA: helix-hairpin-helix domain-containing protein [Bryobacteraceae bacterium]|nr:helix-hairpin-helix domain-containing protein [Bryobacteraceae bacterium]
MRAKSGLWLVTALFLAAPSIQSAELPDGPGKPIMMRACIGCHKVEEFLAYRLTKDEYQKAVYSMVDRGAQATNAELDTIAAYLYKNFPKVVDTTKINVNKASAEELAKGLDLTAKEADAIVSYRDRHGNFLAWGDLLVIYGVDGKKIEAAKDRMTF